MDQGIPLYEKFARELEEMILAGTFPEGGRIPALRESAEGRGLSLSTVLRAYRLLESRGLVEARPQSGYYVKFRPRKAALGPEQPHAPRGVAPTGVSIDDLSMRLIRDRHDPDFARFGAAVPDPALLPTARLNRLLAELAREGRFAEDGPPVPEGREELRIQVAQRAFGYGCDVGPEDIVITSGCSEAMSLCLQAVCGPGDLVAIESPTYFGILLILESLHLRALEIPANPGTGMSLDALAFALENHPVKAVVAVPNFNNPLGSLMPDAAKRQLVALLASRGVPLVENDIYGELYFSERRPAPAKALDDGGGNVLLCSSFSKDISPAYRAGWVAPGRYMDRVRKLKMAYSNGTSILPQLTIARYLETGGYDLHLRKIRKAYARKTLGLARAMEECFPEGTRIAEPLGGYFVWARLPGGLDSMRLYEEALKARITIAPGCLFSPSGKFGDYVRLSSAEWDERTEKDLVRLGRIARDLLDRP
jgi:DNA-binding transcriptional MocR family regulator